MLAVTERIDRTAGLARAEAGAGRTAPGARRGARPGHGPGSGRGHRLDAAFVLAGLAMIPWVFYLSCSLPASARDAHWALAWVGLDSCEALALFATGRFLARRDNRCALTATATAVLVVVDAWFDLTSAAPGADLVAAAAMAATAEIPIAAVCTLLALRVLRSPFPQDR
ncbi:hypothetical protein KGQ19_22000 [Catenulispora sp. NL8]|uniref:Uncharacterized protein n=1 Tax=Catenulispora pinistramenti TaxID=2705254 RepID=A0ABS5KU60_9ACTN|nr:hypothetical protein [Catenulispora pinistramenti]MBS2549540.1 hypothetical protein [Catenulispora pinistramenti]